jgi:hypothetical protein
MSPHRGNVGQTWTMQHGALSDNKVTKKQTFSPGFALLMVVAMVADCPTWRGVERFKSCGLAPKLLPASGVSRTCVTAAAPCVFATAPVKL